MTDRRCLVTLIGPGGVGKTRLMKNMVNPRKRSLNRPTGLVLCLILSLGIINSIITNHKTIYEMNCALKYHDYSHMKYLLVHGADPNIQISLTNDNPFLLKPISRLFGNVFSETPPIRNSPLIIAAYNGDDQIARLLLDHGADINFQAHYTGKTALLASIESRHNSIVQLLLSRHANPNICEYNGYNAAIVSVQSGEVSIIKLLIDTGNFNLSKDKGGMNAIDWAKYLNKADVIHVLSMHGYAHM